MYKRPRVIPVLLLDKDHLVKTVQFSRPTYIGDPINTVKIFNDLEVDELCILDISATGGKKELNYNLLSRMASEAFMPLSYGGGISDIDEIRQLYRIGFEKIILNSAFYSNKDLVRDAVQFAGSQSVLVSIDTRRDVFGIYRCYSHSGKVKHKISPVDLAKEAEECGAGEILLNNIERDGKMKGYDLDLIEKVSKAIRIPLIGCGGAGGLDDFRNALLAGADAVAAGSFFVYYGDLHAVLIHAPSEKDYIKHRIFTEIR